MNAAQMICHCTDAFLGVMGDKPMEMPRGFSFWPMMKSLVLYAPMKWPHGVPTRPEFDQLAGSGTPPAQFEADVRTLLAAIDRFTAQLPLSPASQVQGAVGEGLDALGLSPH